MMDRWICVPLFTPLFFSAVSTQGPKRKANKKGGDRAENDGDQCANSEDDSITPSQVSSKSSHSWLSDHPSIVNERLRPCLSYWIAITTPNGAPANPIIGHKSPSGMRNGGNCKSGTCLLLRPFIWLCLRLFNAVVLTQAG